LLQDVGGVCHGVWSIAVYLFAGLISREICSSP
jgi:hypothetical protein